MKSGHAGERAQKSLQRFRRNTALLRFPGRTDLHQYGHDRFLEACLPMDHLGQFHPVNRLDETHFFHYIFYFIGLQPTDHVNPERRRQSGLLVTYFLYPVFPDVPETQRGKGENLLQRVCFGDGNDTRCGIAAFSRFLQRMLYIADSLRKRCRKVHRKASFRQNRSTLCP